MADEFRRKFVAALTCSLPGCGRRFMLRQTPVFPVCPECQAVIQRQSEREKERAKRARKAASKRALPTAH